jgi:hypothetical protein
LKEYIDENYQVQSKKIQKNFQLLQETNQQVETEFKKPNPNEIQMKNISEKYSQRIKSIYVSFSEYVINRNSPVKRKQK